MRDRKKQKPKEEQEASEAKEQELEELRRQLEDLQKEKDELFGKLQRLSADYANFQKRVPKQISDTVTCEKEAMIKTMLPVLDNFESVMAGLQNAPSGQNADAIVKGVRIIYEHMLDILKLYGVEQIKSLGEKFDPANHEAMMRKAEPDKEDDVVLEELQIGYKLNGRVIRPSRVVVNKLGPEQSPAQQQEQPPAKTAGESQTSSEFETTDTE